MRASSAEQGWHLALAEYTTHAVGCEVCGPHAPEIRCAEGTRLIAAEQAAYSAMRRGWWRTAA